MTYQRMIEEYIYICATTPIKNLTLKNDKCNKENVKICIPYYKAYCKQNLQLPNCYKNLGLLNWVHKLKLSIKRKCQTYLFKKKNIAIKSNETNAAVSVIQEVKNQFGAIWGAI